MCKLQSLCTKAGQSRTFLSKRDRLGSLSLSGIWFAARFALTVQCVLLLLIETLMKTLAKKATWNRLQPALPLMRKRCKIHKGFYFTPRHSRRALPCIFSFFWFHNSTSVSLRPFPPLRFMGPSRRCRDTEAQSCSRANAAPGEKNTRKKPPNGPKAQVFGNPT